MSRFSPGDYERIAALREAGETYREIAAIFGCSDKAISWHCLRLGAEPPKKTALWKGIKGPEVVKRGNHLVRRYTQEDDACLLRLEAEGKTVTEIARALGRKWNSIRGRLMTLARREEREAA